MSNFSLNESLTLQVVVAAAAVSDKVAIVSVFQSPAAQQNQINYQESFRRPGYAGGSVSKAPPAPTTTPSHFHLTSDRH